MGLDVTTDQQMISSGIMIRSDFHRLTDKTIFPTGTGTMHTKARDRVLGHLRELPERIEEDSLSDATQYADAQLQYVAYLLYRRVHNGPRRDAHYQWFKEELSVVNPEIDGQETREMQWGTGLILERG